MTNGPKGGKLPERVAALEQKGESDDITCNARHATEHARIERVEITIWGKDRDGTGGLVAMLTDTKNDLKNAISKMTLLFGLASFLGGAIGNALIQYAIEKWSH